MERLKQGSHPPSREAEHYPNERAVLGVDDIRWRYTYSVGFGRTFGVLESHSERTDQLVVVRRIEGSVETGLDVPSVKRSS